MGTYCGAIVLALVGVSVAVGATAADLGPGGLDAAFRDIRTGEQAPWVRPTDQNQGRLIVQTYPVKRGQNLSALLQENGIRPDVNAFGLVHDLNPDLADHDELKPGQILTIPKIQLPDGATPSKSFAVLSGLELRRAFRDRLDSLTARLGQPDQPVPVSFNPDFNVVQLRTAISEVAGVLKEYRRQEFQLTNEVLTQVNVESEFLLNLTKPGFRPTLTDLATVNHLKSDNLVRTTALREGKSGSTTLRVKTLIKGTEKEGGGYSIHHVPIFLYPLQIHHKRFGRLSSPTEERLVIATYKIWAEKDGKIRSDETIVSAEQLRLNPTFDVDLEVEPSP